MLDLAIRSATIYDGLGREGYIADVGIAQGEVVLIGQEVPEAVRELNGNGLALCPGFIDTHSHSDLMVLSEPELEPKIRQGITTEVLGQDGISAAPVAAVHLKDWQGNLAGLLGTYDQWNWHSIDEYFHSISRKGNATNLAYLIPHGNVRMLALGLEDRAPSVQEMERMKVIVREGLEWGAFGLSTGLIYAPCTYGNRDELVELCRIVAEYDGVFVVHQRSEGSSILESMDEVLEIGRQSGVRIHFSHFKIAGKNNWWLIDQVLEKLNHARQEGLQITLDQYPYTAGSTMLAAILPGWVHAGGTEQLLARLRDNICRQQIKRDLAKGIPGWDNFVEWAGWDGILVTSVVTEKNAGCVGKTLQEIAQMRKAADPADATFDLLLEENNAVGMIDFVMAEDTIECIMQDPYHMVCTDGLLGGKPHPRVYGAFARILARYVREKKVLTLPQAIKKMTRIPADMLRLKNRGEIAIGKMADLLLFDPDKIRDTATYTNPRQYPVGLQAVIVNGQVTLYEGRRSEQTAGRVLKNRF